jgi:hypothetical protein
LVDAIGRMFLCARCRETVVLCSRCDRGQRYCDQVCSRAARRDFQRDAGRRYQDGSSGRAKHAERSRRWRARQQEQRAPRAEDADTGLPQGPAEVPGLSSGTVDSSVLATPDTAVNAQWFCPHCAGAIQPWVRLRFLRRRRTVAARRLARAGPSPPPAQGSVRSVM